MKKVSKSHLFFKHAICKKLFELKAFQTRKKELREYWEYFRAFNHRARITCFLEGALRIFHLTFMLTHFFETKRVRRQIEWSPANGLRIFPFFLLFSLVLLKTWHRWHLVGNMEGDRTEIIISIMNKAE